MSEGSHILAFLGPPGSGKGTQAKMLGARFSVPQICLGDMLREEVRLGTDIGKRIKQLLDAGKLAPDELTIALTRKRIFHPDCRSGFILDGFPRSAAQAEAFDKMLLDLQRELERVVYFKISKEQVVARLSGRRSCKKCGAVYHIEFNPPKVGGKCDACGGELFQRVDDVEGAIRTRFEVYAEKTKPLIDRYREANKLVEIDADGSIEEVFARLLAVTKNGGN